MLLYVLLKPLLSEELFGTDGTGLVRKFLLSIHFVVIPLVVNFIVASSDEFNFADLTLDWSVVVRFHVRCSS